MGTVHHLAQHPTGLIADRSRPCGRSTCTVQGRADQGSRDGFRGRLGGRVRAVRWHRLTDNAQGVARV